MNKFVKLSIIAIAGVVVGNVIGKATSAKKMEELEKKYTEDIECLKCSLDRYDDMLADVEYQRPRYGYED